MDSKLGVDIVDEHEDELVFVVVCDGIDLSHVAGMLGGVLQ